MNLCDLAPEYIRSISPYQPGKPISELAREFGVRPAPKEWKDGVFDRAFVITRSGGEVKLTDLPQRLLPGDSKR